MLLAIPYFSFTTFSIGPLTLHAWGLWVALGFLAGIALAVQTARRRGVNADAVFDLGFWIILGAMVFARLTYIVGDLSFYLSHPLEILRIWEGVNHLRRVSWRRGRNSARHAVETLAVLGSRGCPRVCASPWDLHWPDGMFLDPRSSRQTHICAMGISYFGAIRHENRIV